eukprot:gene1094-6027_t
MDTRSFPLFVRDTAGSGVPLPFDVPPRSTAGHLRALVEASLRAPVRLSHAGAALEDAAVLADAGVCAEGVVEAARRALCCPACGGVLTLMRGDAPMDPAADAEGAGAEGSTAAAAPAARRRTGGPALNINEWD